MKIDLDNPDPEVVALAARTIRDGGIVLSPTDTVYGLACDPFSPSALHQLCRLKGRPPEKGFLVLVSGVEQVTRVAASLPPGFAELARRIWPGPITVLLEADESLPALVAGVQSKVGCRQPDSAFLQSWLLAAGTPLVSTSANRSGEALPATLRELRDLFQGRLDLLLEAGEPRGFQPSSVVDLTEKPPRILRQGAGLRRLETSLELLESRPR